MKKTAAPAAPVKKMVNFRPDHETEAMIEDMRSRRRPIPSVSAIIREAIQEKAARELKR